MPDSFRSRCRMDRERFDAGGRECSGGGVLTWGGTNGEAVASVVPLAACFPSASRKPATGPGSSSVRSRHAGGGAGPLGRACGGHDRKREQGPCRNRAESSSRGPSRPRPGQPGREGPEEGQVKSQPPRVLRGCRLSDGDAIRQVPGRAREQRHPFKSYQRHCPRAALRIKTPSHPGGTVARQGFGLSGCRGHSKALAQSSQSRTSVHPAQLRVVIKRYSPVSSSSGLTRGSIP